MKRSERYRSYKVFHLCLCTLNCILVVAYVIHDPKLFFLAVSALAMPLTLRSAYLADAEQEFWEAVEKDVEEIGKGDKDDRT